MDDGHVGHLVENEDGTIVLDMQDWAGYGGRHHLTSVEEFARWWDDAIAKGFREMHWNDYNFVDC